MINHVDPDPTFVSERTLAPLKDSHFSDTGSTQIMIDAPRNDDFSFRRLCEKRKSSSTLIKFQNNTYASMTTTFVENTLTQLRKVAGDRPGARQREAGRTHEGLQAGTWKVYAREDGTVY
jgi:hypothetical protein